MKNLVYLLILIVLVTFTTTFPTSNTEAQTTISCPDGDVYTCYITAGGTNVRKGKGRTIVSIPK
jgi:hypothetical protein